MAKKKTKPEVTMEMLYDLINDLVENDIFDEEDFEDVEECEDVEEAIVIIKEAIVDEDGNCEVEEEDELNNSSFTTLEMIGCPAKTEDEIQEEEEEKTQETKKKVAKKKVAKKKAPAKEEKKTRAKKGPWEAKDGSQADQINKVAKPYYDKGESIPIDTIIRETGLSANRVNGHFSWMRRQHEMEIETHRDKPAKEKKTTKKRTTKKK